MRPSGAGPEVSVLLPVRDGGALLDRALRSVLGQEGVRLELVVVDDGSTDGTAERLREAARRDPRVRVLHREPRGLVAALDAGLELCRAGVVVRQDHDDLCLPGRLLALRACFEDPRVQAADTGVEIEPGEATGSGMRRWARWHAEMEPDHEGIVRERYVDCPLSAMAFRRAAVLELGGYRDRGWNEDHDLFLRLFAGGARFARAPAPLYRILDRADRLSRRAEHTGLERLRALKAHFLARGELRPEALGGRDLSIWGGGRNAKRMLRCLQAEGVSVARLIDLSPRRVGHRIHGVPVRAPGGLPGPDRTFVLAAVGKAGGREGIRGALRDRGFVEGAHFLAVA